MEPFDVFVRRVCPDFAHVILAERDALREALDWIARKAVDPSASQRAKNALERL